MDSHLGRLPVCGILPRICGAIAVNGYDGFLHSMGFLVAWLGSVLLKKDEDPERTAEMEMRSLTGFGAEKPTVH